MIDPEFGKRFTEIIEKSGISNAKLTELAEISKIISATIRTDKFLTQRHCTNYPKYLGKAWSI